MRDAQSLADARAKALELMAAFNAGDLNLDKALDEIVDVWTGQADRIVRVGETPKPEIQS